MKSQASEVKTEAQFPLSWPKIAGWAWKVNWMQWHFWKVKGIVCIKTPRSLRRQLLYGIKKKVKYLSPKAIHSGKWLRAWNLCLLLTEFTVENTNWRKSPAKSAASFNTCEETTSLWRSHFFLKTRLVSFRYLEILETAELKSCR